jgi:hypothetical protein
MSPTNHHPSSALPSPELSFLGSAHRTLVLGHFGSGKTEVAIATALAYAGGPERPLLLDLDFITPYYRVRDVAPELAEAGVDAVTPEGELSTSDLPVVTARAFHALDQAKGPVIADIGGDEGARVVGSLAYTIPPGTYRAWMVVNPFRPGTGTPAQVAEYARWLERVARVQFTGLVNNANIGPLTEPRHVVEGFERVRSSAEALGVPVIFSAVRDDLAADVPLPEVLPLHRKMRAPWEPR